MSIGISLQRLSSSPAWGGEGLLVLGSLADVWTERARKGPNSASFSAPKLNITQVSRLNSRKSKNLQVFTWDCKMYQHFSSFSSLSFLSSRFSLSCVSQIAWVKKSSGCWNLFLEAGGHFTAWYTDVTERHLLSANSREDEAAPSSVCAAMHPPFLYNLHTQMHQYRRTQNVQRSPQNDVWQKIHIYSVFTWSSTTWRCPNELIHKSTIACLPVHILRKGDDWAISCPHTAPCCVIKQERKIMNESRLPLICTRSHHFDNILLPFCHRFQSPSCPFFQHVDSDGNNNKNVMELFAWYCWLRQQLFML